MGVIVEAERRLYFGYGRNMHPHIMAERCPAAVPAGAAVLTQHRILINGRGVSTVVVDQDHDVHGVLWRLSALCEETLDIIEGVAKGHYSKHETHIQTGDGSIGPALIYLAVNTIIGPPREGYLESLEEAAAHHGFPPRYLRHLAGLR